MSSEQTTSPRRPSRVTCCFGTTLSFLIIVPTFCLALTLRQNAGGELVYTKNPDWKDPDRTVRLLASSLIADVLKATMLVDWNIDDDTCKVDCPEVNIFFDPNLSPSDDRRDEGPSSDNIPTHPIFIWTNIYAESTNDSNDRPLSSNPQFRTKLIIEPTYEVYYQNKLISPGTLASYPFDQYYALVFAFAQEASTNKSVSLVLDSASRFIADLKVTTDNMFGTPSEQRDVFGQEVIYVYLYLQRSTLVIAYCLVITVTFWMVTLMICLIMITTVVFGYRQRNEIVVVPIGTVFAFTQLRSTMPGAPEGFGDILDFAGLLPCLVFLSICAVSMVGIYLFTDPHDPSRKSFTWDELVNVLRLFIRRIWDTTKRWAHCARFRIWTTRRKSSTVVEIPLANLD
ncbi:hypothetical protein EV421DRAFT_1992831 [Armillaria borealis]|uniref:Uncharacterized protein n=1 Tax=Armillaria borealis TaxID=47425 RepID=A0AA39MHP0_9AGAR|nr:hypothetical protein EV421DRAFT_1992831 [Armillaria borealis]